MKNHMHSKPLSAALAAALSSFLVNVALIAPLLQSGRLSFLVDNFGSLATIAILCGLAAGFVYRQPGYNRFYRLAAVFYFYLLSSFHTFVDLIVGANLVTIVPEYKFVPAGEVDNTISETSWYWANSLSSGWVQFLIYAVLLGATLYCFKQASKPLR